MTDAHGVTAIDGPRRGPEADGSQTPNAGSAIRPGKAGSNTDTRKLCTCDGAGRGPGRACVVKAGGRLGELWRCAEGHEPTPGVAPAAPMQGLAAYLRAQASALERSYLSPKDAPHDNIDTLRQWAVEVDGAAGVAPVAPPWEGYLHHWHNAGYPIGPVGVAPAAPWPFTGCSGPLCVSDEDEHDYADGVAPAQPTKGGAHV